MEYTLTSQRTTPTTEQLTKAGRSVSFFFFTCGLKEWTQVTLFRWLLYWRSHSVETHSFSWVCVFVVCQWTPSGDYEELTVFKEGIRYSVPIDCFLSHCVHSVNLTLCFFKCLHLNCNLFLSPPHSPLSSHHTGLSCCLYSSSQNVFSEEESVFTWQKSACLNLLLM